MDVDFHRDIQRPGKHDYYMAIAEDVKTRSHDAETQFGAVFVRPSTGAIVATGYNGFIRQADDDHLPNLRPEKYPYMVHAEENAITACARHGIALDGCIMYCRGTPCQHCTRLLWQCGIYEVIFKEFHPTFEEVKKMKDIEVMVLDMNKGFKKLVFRPRYAGVAKPEMAR